MGPYRRALDVVIERPCEESWSRMEGSDAVRYCRVCSSHVYDLSALARERAEELLMLTEGRVCVRIYRRADGTVATKDCTADRSAHRRRRLRRSVLTGAATALFVGASAALLAALPRAPHRVGHRPVALRAELTPIRTWVDPEELRARPARMSDGPHWRDEYYMGRLGELLPNESDNPDVVVELGEPEIVPLTGLR
jgi:hypothetical protein